MSLEKNNKGVEVDAGRRSFVKRSAAVSTAAAVGPWIISSKALASSGEVNVLLWSDYCPPGFLKSFKEETGITVNFTGIGSNEEIINKMRPICDRYSGSRWICSKQLTTTAFLMLRT